MDHQSILDLNLPSPAVEGNASGIVGPRSTPASVSAGIAAASAQAKSAEAAQLFPNEDGGRSLAAMACRDLEAALQLLADRAQYITGASGAMIALRRGEHNDMVCRASAGSNAPELGALFSMEHGFSGESVRTRQPLRCDDAERDPRVNREGCRQLGIASVVVVPILSDQQVLGVFELFSGKPHAFDERALSAVRRLSEMVEIAVKYAVAAQTVSAIQDRAADEEILSPMDDIKLEVDTCESEPVLAAENLLSAPAVEDLPPLEPEKTEPEKIDFPGTEVVTTVPQESELKTAAEFAPKKPLFWSAVTQTAGAADAVAEAAALKSVPAVLRNLQKCQACGFPVSQGRTYCVECEEKQWRGQRLPQAPAKSPALAPHISSSINDASNISSLKNSSPPAASAVTSAQTKEPLKGPSMPASATTGTPKEAASGVTSKMPERAPHTNSSALFQSSMVESESWLSSNKYILVAFVLVALVIAAIVLLR
ncbi:MAG: diguanylate cyclase [Acidobacteriaceae bacterium]|nr:diguanylate cyclase [Acidobacteriaceae bacterium]